MNHPALVAKQICKSFGSKLVLDKVNLRIEAGECVSLIGANGAGKTTLCETLQGFLLPDSGEVCIFGYSPRKQRSKVLPLLGVVLQDTVLYKRYTVLETLELFKSFYKDTPGFDDIMEKLQLDKVKHKYLMHLSGGQRQKVYLACALIHRPKLLFLDEPSTGLDPESRQVMWQMIQELKQLDCSVLLTTHYLEEAEYLADTLAIIDQGKILALGPLQDLVGRYAQYTTLSLVFDDHHRRGPAVMDEMIGKLLERKEVVKIKSQVRHRLEVYLQPSSASLGEVSVMLEALDMKPCSLQLRRGSLEDVYMHLTGKLPVVDEVPFFPKDQT
ncbi:MAG: ABC transporter ATP-binding protein [Proteobacteria bacterium]|nr:ABC transporter ATP-binding protein [Pseudomonadota bacterium]